MRTNSCKVLASSMIIIVWISGTATCQILNPYEPQNAVAAESSRPYCLVQTEPLPPKYYLPGPSSPPLRGRVTKLKPQQHGPTNSYGPHFVVNDGQSSTNPFEW